MLAALAVEILVGIVKYLPVRDGRALRVACKSTPETYYQVQMLSAYGFAAEYPTLTCPFLDREKEYCEMTEDEFDMTMCYERAFTVDDGELIAKDLLVSGKVHFIQDYLRKIHIPFVAELYSTNSKWTNILAILSCMVDGLGSKASHGDTMARALRFRFAGWDWDDAFNVLSRRHIWYASDVSSDDDQ